MCSFKLKSGQAVVMPVDARPVLQPAGAGAANSRVDVAAGRPTKKYFQRSFSMPASDGTFAAVGIESAVKAAAASSKQKTTTKKESSVGQLRTLVPEWFEPGSIAAAQREQAAIINAQRKQRFAHYGRAASFSSKIERSTGVMPVVAAVPPAVVVAAAEEKRCSFITPYSDPVYVAYHDEEWGMPVHDDNMLFELLVLSAVQVGSDWTSILKRRCEFREAFGGFDPDVVAKFPDRQVAAVSRDLGLDSNTVRAVVENANRVLEVRLSFRTLDKYIWGFVNGKALAPGYKFGRKIPVKTAKSEAISRDMVGRGFRLAGPTIIHSFMQAAGLTNDHLISCPRHRLCASAAAASSGSR